MKIRTIMLGIVLSMMFSVHATATQRPNEAPSMGNPKVNDMWRVWLGSGLPENNSPVANDDALHARVNDVLNTNLGQNNPKRLCVSTNDVNCVNYLDLAIAVKDRCHAGTEKAQCITAVVQAENFFKNLSSTAELAAQAAAKNLARSPRGGRVAEGAGSPNPKRASQEIKLQRTKTPTTAVEGSKSLRGPAMMGTRREKK